MAEPMSAEERDLLAAELALGLLEGEARAQALRLKLADRDFARACNAWAERMAPLCAGFDAAEPPALWPQIEARLGAADEAEERLRFWRWSTLASAAVAAALLLVILLQPASEVVDSPPRSQEPNAVVVAQLEAPAGETVDAFLAANYEPATGVLRIRAIRMPDSALKPELWVIPADGVPRSLGQVSARGVSQLAVAVPRRKLMQEGAVLAITMEPRADAPHARPSGPRVAEGKISTI